MGGKEQKKIQKKYSHRENSLEAVTPSINTWQINLFGVKDSCQIRLVPCVTYNT